MQLLGDLDEMEMLTGTKNLESKEIVGQGCEGENKVEMILNTEGKRTIQCADGILNNGPEQETQEYSA